MIDKKSVLKYTLINTIKFGSANIGAIIGKLLSENPSLKNHMPSLRAEIGLAISKIENKTVEELKKMLFDIDEHALDKKEKESFKIRLLLKDGVKGRVVMRFAPSPSGALHIGHAYVLGLIYAYCKDYDGTLILRIEDTNAANIDGGAYSLIAEDAKWLTNNGIDEVSIQSNRMGTYYKYAEEMLKGGAAYVCTMDNEAYKALIQKGGVPDERDEPADKQMERWKKMFTDYKQGEAVVRIKTNLKHKNPAMRDWPALRINDTPHPLHNTKYRVWPLMNFSVAVDDIEMGMTHIIRGKDHADNAKKQEYVYNFFGKPIPETIFLGRINFVGFDISSSRTKEKIIKGTYSGWDDIRLPFLQALRKRGYTPDAFIKYSREVGPSRNDKRVEITEFFKTINAYNKEVIDSQAVRLFAIINPKEVRILGAPAKEVHLLKHPDDKSLGSRKFITDERFYISDDDLEHIKKGELYRLMELLNFEMSDNKLKFVSENYEDYKSRGKHIIHWIPKSEEFVHIEIRYPDNTIKRGIAESSVKELDVGRIIQFERVGFCRLDHMADDTYHFWFAHR